MNLEQIVSIAQVCLVGLNVLLVPMAFSGIRWVISVERRLSEISVKLNARLMRNERVGDVP